MIELFLLFIILFIIFINYKIIRKIFQIISKFYNYISDRLIVRKIFWKFEKKRKNFHLSLKNSILNFLKINENFFFQYKKIYKFLDFHAVTLKFWWSKTSSKKKFWRWSFFILFLLISYIWITKILLLTVIQFFWIMVDLWIRFIWIFFLREKKWRNQTFDEKVQDYENFRKNLRKFFKRKH